MTYKKAVIIIVTLLILGGLFMILKPESADREDPSSTIIRLDIKDGKLVSGEGLVKVRQNQKITIDVSGDVADTLHLHGYDKSIGLKPGKRQSVTFTADKTGSFEAELHDSKSPVFVLLVQPE